MLPQGLIILIVEGDNPEVVRGLESIKRKLCMRFMFKVVLILLFSFQTAQASLSKGLDAAKSGIM
jgi:hypothetical protein|tara:strand:- start:270 stop:464 length:195 start_codon:yes stop_codon:yes gene_type:complete